MGKKKRRQELYRQEDPLPKKAPQQRSFEVLPAVTLKGLTRKKFIVACLMIFIVAFAVYANTLKSDFIWDDEYLILNNSQIKSFSHLPNVFKTYVGFGSENINNFYRPVQEISDMVDYFLWGLVPFGFHLTNVILHSLVSLMVCVFLFFISGSFIAAAFAALIYAVHPVHTEAVAYIAGRADSLYAFFALLSLALFVRFAQGARENRFALWKYVLSIACFVLALLSKEIIITMPLLIYLYLLYFEKGEGGSYSKLKWAWVPYAVIVVVYGYLRLTVLSFADIAPASVFGRIPLLLRLVTFFRTLLVYFGLLIMPVGLHMERAIPISATIFSGEELASIMVVALIIWSACWSFRKNRLVSFGIAWFFANLLPVSNIIPINSFLAEHWLYMASIGIFFIVGLGVKKVYEKIPADNLVPRLIFTVILALAVGFYAFLTVQRNMDWKNEVSFFTSTLKYHPKNARLYLNLGNTYYEKGDVAKAVEQYKKSIEINPGYAVAYGNIGSAYLHEGNIEAAEEYLKKAINYQENYPIAHYNLGIIYHQKRAYDQSIEQLKLATQQLPQFYQAWNMLGRIYLQSRRVEEAREAFGRSLSIMKNQPEIRDILQKLENLPKP